MKLPRPKSLIHGVPLAVGLIACAPSPLRPTANRAVGAEIGAPSGDPAPNMPGAPGATGAPGAPGARLGSDSSGAPLTRHDPAASREESATFDPGRPAALEVRRAPTGHLLVRAAINGVPAGWFIFDTGAGMCVVSSPHLAEFGLTPDGTIAANGVVGGTSASLTRAERLELGPLTLRDHPLLVTDLSFLRDYLGEEVAGVIGFGVLSRCVAEIDPLESRIALFDPAGYRLEGTSWLPVELEDRIPAVRARFEDREGLFHIDTGANGGVSFTSRAVERWKLLEDRELQDAKLGGVGGFVAAKRGNLAWFELGGLRQQAVSATFPLESKGVLGGERIDGSLGAEVLRPFLLITDLGARRVAFRARAPAGG